MKKFLLYTFITSLFAAVSCNDDDRSFDLMRAIGFSVPFININEDELTTVHARFSANTSLSEVTTVEVAVTDVGLEYGVDYVTEPAVVDGKITLAIDPEDTEPGIAITNLVNNPGLDTRKVYFTLTSVNGSGLSLGQSLTTSFIYSITERQLDPNQLTITDVRAMYTGSAITLSVTKFIEGVVISSNDNVTAKNVFIQDHTGGIVLRFNANNTTHANKIVPGDKVRVPLSGVTLTAFNGLLQLGDGTATLPNDNVQKLGTAPLPAPIEITIAQLNTNAYQSMLVKISGVTFAAADGTKTVTGNNTFSDGTASATMRVESYAPFASKVLPSGAVTLTGVASTFTTAQLAPMKESDIQ